MPRHIGAKRPGFAGLALALLILGLGALPSLHAAGVIVPACPTSGTLADLMAFNSNTTPGCLIGSLRYSGFSWTESVMSTTTLAPNQVSYTTASNSMQDLLDFSSAGFTVTGNQTLIYTLVYTVDPPPIIIRELDQDMIDPTTAPGISRIPTKICLGAAFTVTGTCPTGTTVTLTTFDDGIAPQLNASVSFTPQSTIGISTVIDLEANTQHASITGFGDTTNISPEPATYLLVALGLAALAVPRRNRARLLSISERKSD